MHVVILMYTVSVSGVFYCWLILLIVMNLVIHVASADTKNNNNMEGVMDLATCIN